MTPENEEWNRENGVQKGPQNIGYIEREDGEPIMVKYDWSQPYAWVFEKDEDDTETPSQMRSR